jgi:GLPGLI family protein
MKKIIFIFSLVLFNIAFSQNNEGIAIYKKKIELIINNDGDTTKNKAAKDFVNKIALEGVEEAKNLEFELIFKYQESQFRVKPALSLGSEMAKEFAVMLEGGKGILYSDLANKSFLLEKEAFGETFLISSSIDSLQWEITNEKKMISEYNCYKAVGSNKSTQNEVNSTEAWFAPDISIPFGPAQYCNLPGLIIELKVFSPKYKVTFYLKRLDFSDDKSIKIVKPNKGIKVTEEEFKSYGKKMQRNFLNMK